MARRIFWGVFLLVIACALVVFANFSSSAKIEEALREMGGDAMPVGRYPTAMIEFYNEHQRWPTSAEIVLPEPPVSGIVQSVDVEPDGMLVLTLRQRFWLQKVKVKMAVILQPLPQTFGMRSACVNVTPSGIARVIFAHCGHMPMTEIQEMRQRAIPAMEERSKDQPTSCYRQAEEADRSGIAECVATIDAESGRDVAAAIKRFSQSRKITQSQLHSRPSALDKANQECDEQWSRFRNGILASHPQTSKCFYQ